MARGGYQQPQGGPRAPGVGKNSQRTDANDPPRISDSPDLQYGDRKRLQEAQKVAPRQKVSGSAPASGTASPRRSPSPPPRGGRSGAGILPSFLLGASDRPGEPVTSGLDIGAGEGSEVLNTPAEPEDPREAILAYYAMVHGNADAHEMLEQIRAARMPQAPMAPPTPMLPEEPTE